MRKLLMKAAKIVMGRIFLRIIIPCIVIGADLLTRSRFGISILNSELLDWYLYHNL